MKNKSGKRIFVFLLILLGSVGLVYGLRFVKSLNLSGLTHSKESNRSKGNKDALVKVIEYMDYQCPACAKGSFLLNEYLKHYPGKLYLEAKFYPLDMHIHGMRAARYAQCASLQGKFWQVHDNLFFRQAQWKDLMNAEPAFGEILNSVKINPAKLDQCLSDPKMSDLILQDKQSGTQAGVKSTPTYFINGKMIVGTINLENELKTLLGPLPVPAVIPQ